ncbi:MAG: sensory box protein [uncultured bacterium (gcode 4)]|uniref:Sensory box protein n=1 Tax=uncultured bacterium (gcode 4) TaxID=1234023 RepID=K2H323_9BACT|nr:MAG: sensory box protein [uncultured bacterium (gcode 4)]
MEIKREDYPVQQINNIQTGLTKERILSMVEDILHANIWVSHADLVAKVSSEISKKLLEKTQHDSLIRNLLNSFTDEMVNFQDQNHKILYCNDAFATFVWFPKEEIIWKFCYEILCNPDNCVGKCPIERIKKWNNSRVYVEYDWIYMEKSANAVMDDDGEFIWYVELYKDRSDIIKQNRKIEEQNAALARTNEFLSSALSNSKQWTWEWNILTGEVRADENFYKMLWYDKREVEFNYDFWELILHPEDKKMVMSELKKSAQKPDRSFQFTYRLLSLDWNYIWITASGKVSEIDIDWKPTKALWTHMDITEITSVKSYLRTNEQKLSAILQSIPDLLVVLDRNWVYREIYTGNSKFFLWPRKIGSNIWEIFDKKNRTVILEWINKAMDTWITQHIEYSLNKYWLKRKYSWSCQLLWKDQVVIITRDVTEEKKMQEKIRHMATHDNLTWLSNRLSFNEKLQHTINQNKRNKKHFAVLFIDLDKFKQVNDTHWHKVWDKLLIEVSKRLLSATRWSDIVSRFWWDEFWIVLPMIEKKEDYEIVAKRIIDSLSKPFDISWKKIQIWSSIWISLYPDHWEDLDSIIHSADVAMYTIKNWTKNSFSVYQPPEKK